MALSRDSLLFASFLWTASCGGSTTSGEGGTPAAAEAGADVRTSDGRVFDAAICTEKERAVGALLVAAETTDGSDLSCQTNDDCRVVVVSTNCTDNCSVNTTRAVEEKIRAAIAEANSTVCPGFFEAGCQRIIPPCNPGGAWICAGGMCSRPPP